MRASLIFSRRAAPRLENPVSRQWELVLVGPPDTPYEGGIFKAMMQFPDDFPNQPPEMTFLSKMYHPNVYEDGKVSATPSARARRDRVRAACLSPVAARSPRDANPDPRAAPLAPGRCASRSSTRRATTR